MTREEAINKIQEVLFDSQFNNQKERSQILMFEIEKFMVPKPRKVIVGRKWNQDITHNLYTFEPDKELE